MATSTAEIPQANIPGAGLRFPDTHYVTLPNIPVFREHKTKAVDGRTLEFGREQLQMVCDRCNRRIAETGDYAAVVIGHTCAPDDPNPTNPELVGYAGPFRLGTIGEGDRKGWAILADFHVFRDCMAAVRKHPRRSPELCFEDTYEEMYLDPIALLGAEAPRLDLGLMTGAQGSDGASLPAPESTARKLYSFVRNGRLVEKYAMAAMAPPAASNVFAPSDKITPPKKYAAEPPKPGATTMLTPEDISAVVQAFLSTDAGQFLVSEMEAKRGTNAIVEPGQEPPAAVPGAAPGAAPAAVPAIGEPSAEPPVIPAAAAPGDPNTAPPQSAKPPEVPSNAKPEHAEPDGDEAKKYAAACSSMDGMKDEQVEKYLSARWKDHPKWKKYAAECSTIEPKGEPAAGEVVNETGDPQGTGAGPASKKLDDHGNEGATPAKPTEFYSRVAAAEAAAKAAQTMLATEQATRKQIERYSRMQGLSAEFVMSDIGEEMAMVADMNDAQFERHINKTIREHYQRNPVGLPWPATNGSGTTYRDPSHPQNVPISQEASDKQAKVAVERYQRKRAAGEACDFAEILEEVKAGK